MSWKAALDMGCLSKMTYEWLEFCQVMYHMFGGGVMNTLRGRAHFCHVTSSKSRKGYRSGTVNSKSFVGKVLLRIK